jgi:hypothetical protein
MADTTLDVPADAPDINAIVRDHAMLVSLHIKGTRFEIKDNEAAAAAAQASGALSSAAYYAKKHLLFTADERLKKVHSIGNALRAEHNQLTMAWDTGKSPYRMLPVANFMRYTEVISKGKRAYEAALDDMVAHYPEDSRKARAALNLPDTADVLRMYPRQDELKTRFGIEVLFEPIAEGAQFRNIPPSAAKALGQAFEHQVTSRFKRSLTEAYTELRDLLANARENLSKEDDAGQKWKDASITNIVETARIMQGFNFLKDPEHVTVCDRIEARLGHLDSKDFQSLRKPGADRRAIIDTITELEIKVENLLASHTE